MGDRDISFAGSDFFEKIELMTPLPHRVKIPRGFAVSMQEIPSKFSNYASSESTDVPELSLLDSEPLHNSSWNDAAKFCNSLSTDGEFFYQPAIEPHESGDYELSEEAHLKFSAYRLPTEAEWEFCCRAGSLTSTTFGDRISNVAVDLLAFRESSLFRAKHPPNQYGFFDTHGSVSEWCDDRPRRYPFGNIKTMEDHGTQIAPEPYDPDRILRGGSSKSKGLSYVYSFHRQSKIQGYKHQSQVYSGFRLALTIPTRIEK